MKTPRTPWRLGLTGGIGSGKSTVAGMLARRGAAVVDADAISRALTLSGGAAMPAIAQTFGPEVVAPDGALDRDAMRQRVFADAQARARLEAIVHPLVALETARQAKAAALAGASCVVFDVPLLVESGRWRSQVDAVLVVDCSPAVQVQRVMHRNGWSQEAVERVIASQAPRARRLAAADTCLCNEALSLEELDAMVGLAWKYFGL